MFARSTTVRAELGALDAGTMHMRDRVMPVVMETDGCVGLSLIVDRTSGRCIATTSWESEAALQASERSMESVRREAVEEFRGSVERVDRWEISAMHREHQAREGACVRCTWLQVPDVDRATEAFRGRVLPRVEQMAGFCSGSFFVDRGTGRAVSGIAWDTKEAMDGSREGSAALRAEVTGDLGGEVLDVAEFELFIAHLRAPELV